MRLPISAIILTYNEELNIEKCIASIYGHVGEIIIVDSFSTDKTIDIIKKYECRYFERKFVNQAEQFNWALDNVSLTNDWVLRLDADEEMLPETWSEIESYLNAAPSTLDPAIAGFYMKRRVYFLGRWMKHGGYYPAWFLRLWRKDAGRYEEREMDEHVVLSRGRAVHLQNDIVEKNQKDLSFWIQKHNDYATREARAYLAARGGVKADRHGTDPERRRYYKESIYYKLPPFLRPWLYYMYRYIFRLGFLDGVQGLIWHTLQGFWYRFLVDAKIYALKKKHD